MDSMLDIIGLLEGDTTTFVVGPDENQITLHDTAIALESTVLATNIKWSLEQERASIQLPEVDWETFKRFAGFCYTKNYGNSNLTKALHDETQRILSNVKQEGGFSCFKCGAMVVGHENYHLFPFCVEPCNVSNTSKNETGFCPVCGNMNVHEPGTICDSCNDPFERRAGHAHHPKWAKLNGYAHVAGVPKIMLSNVEPVENPDALPHGLLCHAKVAVFADVYGCKGLRIMALAALAGDIAEYPVNSETIPNVVELLEYIYDNTEPSDDYGDPVTDVLRDMVCEFAGVHCHKLLQRREYSRLLGDGGDLAVDLYAVAVLKISIDA